MIDSTCYPQRREPPAGGGAAQEHAGQPPSEAASRGGLRLRPGRGWQPINLLWLIYSGFFLADPLQGHLRGGWPLFAAVYVCFVAIYALFLWVRPAGMRALLLLAIAALAAAYYPIGASTGGGMFIYVAALAPFMTTSLAAAAGMILAAALASAAEGFLLHLNPWAWGSFAFLGACAGTANLIRALREAANQRLFRAQEQIEHLAKVAERERIARDMHDVLGHTLSVVVLKSELAGKLMAADAARARQEIGEVELIARQALSEVREAIRGYRAEGIAAEIARARRALDAAGVRLQWQAPSVRLAAAHESVLSLVLREAVTNILRHAGASSCRLELTADSQGTRLTVQDDGRGASGYAGNGVRGMRERVEAVGGRMEIDSRQGTRLTVDLPAWAEA